MPDKKTPAIPVHSYIIISCSYNLLFMCKDSCTILVSKVLYYPNWFVTISLTGFNKDCYKCILIFGKDCIVLAQCPCGNPCT